ncbi:autophagy-related protein 16-1-like [Centruroides sculpturatus]|uniref:autophagy-related protein 16-1-like n=1 Tax=Centruroides sculpturatus TaxID=218467 RepID=UPI000C6D603D|nr:autophagy-related protein 16-1-like [Centruroides sculpturatus]
MADGDGAFVCEWRRQILNEFQKRHQRENGLFEDLFALCNRLYENIDLLQKENIRLKIQKARLEQDTEEGSTSSGRTSEKVSVLDRTVFQLKSEITELHRTKANYAQQLMELRNTLDEKEKELLTKNNRLKELEMGLSKAKEDCKVLEQTIQDKDMMHQVLKDEYEALHLAFSSLENNYNRLEKEHQDIISRWIALKTRDADRLNAETERVQKLKQYQVQKELEEAARDQVVINPSEVEHIPICISACLPSKVTAKIDGHDGDVNAIRWTPSGLFVASGGGDRKVKLWEIANGQILIKSNLIGSNAAVMSLDFNAEESLLLGSSNDFASRVWTVADSRLRHTLTGHGGKVMAAKFLGESSKVVSGSHDRTLKIWDLRSRACIRTIFAGSSCNDVVTSDGAGTNIISGHFDKRIRFWDTRSESNANEIQLQGKVTSLDLSPDGMSLLSCVRDDSLKLLDLHMNQVMRTFCADGFKVGCDWTRAKFSPDGHYVIAGSQDGAIYIWNTSSGKIEKVLREHNAVVTACAWNPTGNHIISCDRAKKIVVWSEF